MIWVINVQLLFTDFQIIIPPFLQIVMPNLYAKFLWRICNIYFYLNSSDLGINPIPAGGGSILPPPFSFFAWLKEYLSEDVEIFWLFLHTQSPPFRPKPGL